MSFAKFKIQECSLAQYQKVLDYFLQDPIFESYRQSISDVEAFRVKSVENYRVELIKDFKHKDTYVLAMMVNDAMIGYSCLKNIQYGNTAQMHGHIFSCAQRGKGVGTEFFYLAIKNYFNNFALKKIIIEPTADNIAINKLMAKTQAEFVKTYLKYNQQFAVEQIVNLYVYHRKDFLSKIA